MRKDNQFFDTMRWVLLGCIVGGLIYLAHVLIATNRKMRSIIMPSFTKRTSSPSARFLDPAARRPHRQ